jgi:hypothetical protein
VLLRLILDSDNEAHLEHWRVTVKLWRLNLENMNDLPQDVEAHLRVSDYFRQKLPLLTVRVNGHFFLGSTLRRYGFLFSWVVLFGCTQGLKKLIHNTGLEDPSMQTWTLMQTRKLP